MSRAENQIALRLRRVQRGSITVEDSLRERIAELEAALRVTRAIVSDGAMVGFNPHDGDWAERLFKNQGAITALVPHWATEK